MLSQIKSSLKLLTLAALVAGCVSPNGISPNGQELAGCWQVTEGDRKESEIWSKLNNGDFLVSKISGPKSVTMSGPVSRSTLKGRILDGGAKVALTDEATGKTTKRTINYKDGKMYFDYVVQTACLTD